MGEYGTKFFSNYNRRIALSFYIVQLVRLSEKNKKAPKWVEVETSHDTHQL